MQSLIGKLRCQSRLLPLLNVCLSDITQSRLRIRQRHPVRLDQIVGTAGSLLFDAAFRPTCRDYKTRWVSVAIAMLSDPTSLSPIQAVEVKGKYYVTDGHHRVSVARALKNLYIDANVVSWG